MYAQQERHNCGERTLVSKFQVHSQSFRNFNESENTDGGRDHGSLHLLRAMRKAPPKKASDSAIQYVKEQVCLITRASAPKMHPQEYEGRLGLLL